ncbi:MAG TPA: TIGR01777 family oxidoreductase, partial [Nannocystaceae bacterium]|nr:TIGR01777 family oxidoreductase [Nannocystaceae bacterium]
MNVLVMGATGFIGRSLVLRLARDGHRPIAWVRNAGAARSQFGADVEIVDAKAGDDGLVAVLSRVEAVINLAGAPISRRWTKRVRAEAHASRVTLTERLVAAIARAEPRPPVLVNGSAVGFYGDRGDDVLDESAAPGRGMLADLCSAWESAARGAERHGVRVVVIRIGVVLGTDGGALVPMLATTRLGLGATFGAGRQFMPWIHRRDIVEMIACAVADERWSGVFNGTAPTPARNRELADALAHAAGRRRWFRVPGLALRLALGEAADIVLASQRAVPTKALALGFAFRFAVLTDALHDLLHGHALVSIDRAHDWPDVPVLRERTPVYRLETATTLDRPIDEVWAFFASARNLAALTPDDQGFELVGEVPEQIHAGDIVDVRVGLGPIRLPWRTRIETVEPNRRFRDSAPRGPFRVWLHEHEFEAHG